MRARAERGRGAAPHRRLTLADVLARHPHRPGAGTIRAILERASAGLTRTRSELEARFVAVVDAAGLPRPRTNARIRIGSGSVECDAVWTAQRLVVELDGHAAHGTRAAYERDRRRDRALQAAGWRVVRVTWRELARDPEGVVGDLRALLGA